jgi:hypothetical protein
MMRIFFFLILILSPSLRFSLLPQLTHISLLTLATSSDPQNTTDFDSSFILFAFSATPSPSKPSTTHAQKREFIVQSIFNAMRSGESCDWKAHPLLFLSGILCGKHYKILQLPSHRTSSSSVNAGPSLQEIRSRYYQLSKVLHPDKNPMMAKGNTADGTSTAEIEAARAAQEAFVLLTESYQCLKSKSCKADYDHYLSSLQAENRLRREEKWHRWQKIVSQAIFWTHHSLSIAANVVDQGSFPSFPPSPLVILRRYHITLEAIWSC